MAHSQPNDLPTSLGGSILTSRKGKGKAPASRPSNDNRSSSHTEDFMTPEGEMSASDQFALFVDETANGGNDAPVEDTSPPTRKRSVVDRMNELKERQRAKRARTNAAPADRNTSRPSQVTKSSQPDPLDTQAPQGSGSAQPDEPGASSAQPAGVTNSTVDLTGDDNEDDGAERIPPGHTTLHRTKITAPHADLGKAVQAQCHRHCRRVASTLSGRTDPDGKIIFQRCMGAASLLKDAKTLGRVRQVMAADVKDVLADAHTSLSKLHNKYDKFFQGMSDARQEPDFKQMLDRQHMWVELVEQVRNWRKDLVNDLKDLSPAFLDRHGKF